MNWLQNSINYTRDIQRLYEMTNLQMKRNAGVRMDRVHSQKLMIKYQGVDKKGHILFSVSSGTIRGKFYQVSIELKDFKEAKDLEINGKTLSNKEILQLSLSGDLKVHCTCPDFKYRFSYLAWKKGYGIIREQRYPKVQNRNLQGTACKHTLAVLQGLNAHFTSILSGFIKQGLLQSESKKKLKKVIDTKNDKNITQRKSREVKKQHKKENNAKLNKT